MNKDVPKAFALFTQVAISMLVPIFLCFFIGRAVDRILGVNGIFLIIFTVMGILAGFRSVYMIVKSFFKDKDTYVDMNKIKRDIMKGDENIKNKKEVTENDK